MILFLTSSPTGDLDGKYTCTGLDKRNGFADKVREFWHENARVLMVTAFPDDENANAHMTGFFSDALTESGLSYCTFDLWDRRVLADEKAYSREVLHSYNVILLGGGHVPTQQAFFEKLHLRESFAGYDGMVIGISAGTMNSADVVYAQPEEPGEAVDPNYQRFIRGLGLTRINVLPHYQMVKDNYLDGLHLFREISIPDSVGRCFIALPDGSYIMDGSDFQRPIVYGLSYLLKDGRMTEFTGDDAFQAVL